MDNIQKRVEHRINWVDYAKGVAIILVLVGHGLPAHNIINIWAYSFHMPLFFIISGLMIKPQTLDCSIGKIIKKYAKGVLLPYYIFAGLTAVIEILKDILQKEITSASVMDILIKVLSWQGVKADWFLPCLFIAIIFTCIIYKSKKKYIGIGIMGLFTLFLCIFMPNIEENLWSDEVLVLLRAVIATFFVTVGCYLRAYFIDNDKRYSTRKELFLCIVLFISNIILTGINGKVSLNNWNFGMNGLLYLVNSILGSLFIIFLMRLLNMKELRLLKYCGQNSLIIMATHMEIMALLGAVFEKLLSEGVIFYSFRIVITFFVSLMIVPFGKKMLPKKRNFR